MKFLRALIILMFLKSFTNAQSIDIGGIVTNKAGKAIAGAEVTLKHESLKDTTSADGHFRIRTNSTDVHNAYLQTTIHTSNGTLEIVDLAGHCIRKQDISNHENITIKGLNSGIFIVKTTINHQIQYNRLIVSDVQGKNGASLRVQGKQIEKTGLRSAAVSTIDTLQIVKNTYKTALVALTSLIDTNMIVVLDSGTSSQPSSGCGKTFTRPDPSVKQTIQVAGSGRTYQIYVPANYSPDKPLPLIFALHGGGGSAASARSDYKLEAVTKNDAIIVYPESSFWNYGSGSDMAFFDTLLKDIKNKFCIDAQNVYATGFSLGGIFVNGVGCIYGGKEVRGIIPVAGSGPNPNMGPASESDIACPAGKPTGKLAVLIIHGTTDGNAAYKYGQWEANYWSKWNGCTSTTISGSAPFDGCKIYQGCQMPVYFYTHSGGHMIPGNAATLIWEFIKLLN